MMPVVLLAIHDHARTRALRDAATAEGYRVHVAATLADARRIVAQCHIDVAFVDEALDPHGVLAAELRRRQTTPRSRLVRLLDRAAPATGTATAWRPDASLRGDVTVERTVALLALLAPIARIVPSA